MSGEERGACLSTPEELRSSVHTRNLHVLTLTPFYPSTENPSEGCFIAEILPLTQQLGIENEVIAARPFYRRLANIPNPDIPGEWKQFFSVPGNLGLPLAGAFLARSLITAIRDAHHARAFDLIHAHTALPCGEAAARLSKALRIPFVVSVHGLDVFSERQAGRPLGGWCRRVSERVYCQARAVICISEKVRERITIASVNSTVIHNGVDASMFSPGKEQESPLVILSVGNLIPTKGHALLLQAFAQTLPFVPDCELEIIGEGPERRALTCLSEELGINSRVRFLGGQSREDVARAMQRCAVFALPSEYEGLGCVYLEAMASAKPAIGCEGQGIDEIIEHGTNGWLVPPGAEAQLSDALRMLLQNQDFRLRLGNAARSTVLQRHTLKHQAEQLAEVYRGSVL